VGAFLLFVFLLSVIPAVQAAGVISQTLDIGGEIISFPFRMIAALFRIVF